jgi:hypothetical protein
MIETLEILEEAPESLCVSLTAFYLCQLSRPSFLIEPTAPQKSFKQKMEENALRRAAVLSYMQGKGAPANARELIDYFKESKETIRSTIDRMERDKVLRRINVNRVLHWEPR